MEFYLAVLGGIVIGVGFNSQRDGILPTSYLSSLCHKMFQFPTGWNSTFCLFALVSFSVVSIPNGMEFYFKEQAMDDAEWRFNSQRDGILR